MFAAGARCGWRWKVWICVVIARFVAAVVVMLVVAASIGRQHCMILAMRVMPATAESGVDE